MKHSGSHVECQQEWDEGWIAPCRPSFGKPAGEYRLNLDASLDRQAASGAMRFVIE